MQHNDSVTAVDLPRVAVFDVDGTLADTRRREHHLRGRKDWDAFFAAAADDEVHPEGMAVHRTAIERGLTVVYLSGRPEAQREASLRWLRENRFVDGELLLRPPGDRRPATVVKLEALIELAKRARLELLVDDDPAVIAAVRACGLVTAVLHATWQRTEPTRQMGSEGTRQI